MREIRCAVLNPGKNIRGKMKTLGDKLKLFAVGFLVFLVLAFVSGANQAVAEDAQRPFQLVEANHALQDAFVPVLEAEEAGADVTGLLGQLSSAADLLAQAEMSYRIGDVYGAVDKAAGVSVVASEVETDALRVSSLALNSGEVAIYSSVAISFVGGFSFVFVVFLVWKWFRQYYVKRLLNSQPEVKTAEA